MKIEEEVSRLASELVRRFPDEEIHECNIAQEMAEFMTDDDFLYQLPETPYFLEKSGLAEIQSTDLAYAPSDYWRSGVIRVLGDISQRQKQKRVRILSFKHSLSLNGLTVRGFFAVSFKLDAMRTWHENQMNEKLGTISGSAIKVPTGWKWFDEEAGIYQFGPLGRFEEGRGAVGKIFHEAMNLFHETPQCISIAALSQRTGVEHKVLRSRLKQISQKLDKVGIKFVGSGKGYYRIESTKEN